MSGIFLSFFGGGSAAFSATGGTVTAAGIVPGNGYRYHVFTSPGTFSVSGPPSTIEYLIVAGGGGGGAGTGGGGGAGGFRTASGFAVSPGTYPVSVGQGGDGGVEPGSPSYHGNNGGNSSFGPISSDGGGGGTGFYPSGGYAGFAGGSGGGGGRGGSPYNGIVSPGGAGNQPTSTSPPQGNPGGTGGAYAVSYASPNHSYGGGGGGGASTPGGNASVPGDSPVAVGGTGGNGSPIPAFAAPLISPEIPGPAQPTWIPTVGPTGLYAGGGGGSASKQVGANPASPGPGGSGGGGAGSTPSGPVTTAQPGVNYTGSGGGGSGGNGAGGSGGPGIVIIRYLA